MLVKCFEPKGAIRTDDPAITRSDGTIFEGFRRIVGIYEDVFERATDPMTGKVQWWHLE
jgi:hypothetical protein